jgi:hypothetical protein
LNEKSSWIGLKKNQGAGLESGCNIEWDLEQSTGKQLWVTIWIYVGRRADRDRLFSALAHEKGRLPESKTVFERSGGSASLSSYLDLDLFYSFDATFFQREVEFCQHSALPTSSVRTMQTIQIGSRPESDQSGSYDLLVPE